MTPITKAEALAMLDRLTFTDRHHALRDYLAASIDPQEVRKLRTWPSGISETCVYGRSVYYAHEVLALSTPLPEPEPLCDRCGKARSQHEGPERFCPFTTTYRAAQEGR